MNNKLILKDLGVINYKDAWDYQEELVTKRIKGKFEEKDSGEDVLLFCEHPHVYTLGKSGDENNLLIDYIQMHASNAEFYRTNRGGDITYHGPGQIVGYPIIDLDRIGIGIRKYIYLLEESVIRTLHKFDIKSVRLEGATGVWLDTELKGKTRKICAIGVKVSRGITMHGYAFNINTELNYFNHINPCGFTDKGVTSLSKELNQHIDLKDIKVILYDKLNELINN